MFALIDQSYPRQSNYNSYNVIDNFISMVGVAFKHAHGHDAFTVAVTSCVRTHSNPVLHGCPTG